MVILWIVAAVIFLIVEAITAAMSSIWFVAGALGALVCAVLGGAVWLQVLIFLALSGLCFAILYPRLKNLLRRDRQATNADMVLARACCTTRMLRIRTMTTSAMTAMAAKVPAARLRMLSIRSPPL